MSLTTEMETWWHEGQVSRQGTQGARAPQATGQGQAADPSTWFPLLRVTKVKHAMRAKNGEPRKVNKRSSRCPQHLGESLQSGDCPPYDQPSFLLLSES